MSFLKDLNPVQRKAVKTIDGPVMVLAGAGSGKTRVLTYRIAYLIQCGVPAHSILALTFTNKAAREMRERIEQVVSSEDAGRLWMGTFHSIFARLLRKDADKLGFRRNFSIYDTDDSQNLIKAILSDNGISTQQVSPAAVRHFISRAKNRLTPLAELANTASDIFEQKAVQVYEEYINRLLSSNAMDFDDLIIHPIRLFDNHADVLESYQNRFRFILIDEYQDTNHAQYEIVRRLAAAHHNICIVGDDAQSIYAFRGADIRNILDFEKNFPDTKTFRLEQNYRSTKIILNGAASLIRHNVSQLEKTLWTDNPEGDPITVLETSDESEEAQKIVYLMQEESRRKKLQLRDFAVLYRTNSQSRALEDAFRRSGIPYTIVGGVAFYRRKEIKDILGYLRLFVNPSDEEALLRVINYPARGIGQTTVRRLRSYAREEGVTVFEAAMNANSIPAIGKAAANRILEFVGLVQKFSMLRHEISAGELAGSLVDQLGIIAEFKREGTQEARMRMENIQELLSALSEFRTDEGLNTLEAFLAEASLIADVDAMDPNRNAVTLMTFHSAKGLEFPVVFLVGMEESLFPSSQSIERQEVEEERRLCYVGMTRAMNKLYMSYARSRMRWGERLQQMPSRFLEELDGAVIKKETTRRRAPARRSTSPAGNGQRKRRSSTKGEYSQLTEESWSQIDEFGAGTMVIHATFGRGEVLSIQGTGDMARAVVLFESVGKKTLVLKFAGLRPA